MEQEKREIRRCLYHLLMWTYKDDTPAEQRASLEAELSALPAKVPTIRSLRWGPVTGGRNQSFSHCFVMLLADQAGLEASTAHPAHFHSPPPSARPAPPK